MTPNIPASEYVDDPRAQMIARAAKRLDERRNAWLNPPDLVRTEPEVAPGYPDRILPRNADAAAKLKERTLTKLYNERPQWLDDAHRELDAAVAAAYSWPADISEEEALAKLLELNLQRSAKQRESAPESKGRRRGTDTGADQSETTKERVERPEKAKPTIIGREAFAKISQVEGIELDDEGRRAFAEFDRRKLTAAERRRAIMARFKREAAE